MLTVIPARGNSKGIPRKNLSILDGRPLLCHIADRVPNPVVSTEDPEIRSVALSHGYQVVDRPAQLSEDDVPVAAVVQHACEVLDYDGPLIAAQPTCPHVTETSIGLLIQSLDDHNASTLVAPNTHILRDTTGRITQVANRQYLDGLWREVGVRAYRSAEYLSHHPTGTVEVSGREATDIDTYGELWEAQAPKRISIRYVENHRVGTGHRRRAEALAAALGHHKVTFDGDGDIHVLDVLDTTEAEVAELKACGAKVVSFEDRGPGARLADLVVNALYPKNLPHELTGPDYAILRPEFIGLPPFQITDKRRILAMFGGTDPSNYGPRISEMFDVTWIRPGDNASVAYEMMNHDLLITSAGRTVYEAQAVGIPCVVLAQNHRETTHAHLEHTVFLGLLASDIEIQNAVYGLLDDAHLREELSVRRVDGRGLERVVRAIEGL